MKKQNLSVPSNSTNKPITTVTIQGAAKKSSPLKFFLPFSRQPLGILTWNFTGSFTETFYI